MEELSVEEVVKATGGKLVQGCRDYKIHGISTDSRKIIPGDLFVPLAGCRFDGHDFIPQAIKSGAKTVLTSREIKSLPDTVNVILVHNTLEAFHRLAGYYRRKFSIPLIAVTGSTGKTTTKDMIYSVLSQRYSVLKTEGNYNNEIGVPLTIFNLGRQHEIAVVEMGMSGFGEISRLVDMALPTVGIITNIGVSHIEKLGSRENILKAKMEIFDKFHSGCMAILNGDDELLWGIKEDFPFEIKYFGTRDGVDFKAEKIESKGENGCSYSIRIGEEVYSINLRIPGRHNVYNSLAAVAVGCMFDLSINEIKFALENFRTAKMRLDIFATVDGIKVIDDVYNASPDSMKAALSILKEIGGARKIAVLGDMLELGKFAVCYHRQVGVMVVQNNVDILITKGDLSRWIGRQAKDMGMSAGNIFHFSSNEGVMNLLDSLVKKGDVILVKGSRGMNLEEVVSYLRERRT